MLRPSPIHLARALEPLSKQTKPTGRGKPVLSLDHFLQRQRVLTLWREIVRATNRVPDPGMRREMRGFARDEFTRYRAETDLGKIRYLLSTGREQFRSMQRYVDEMGM